MKNLKQFLFSLVRSSRKALQRYAIFGYTQEHRHDNCRKKHLFVDLCQNALTEIKGLSLLTVLSRQQCQISTARFDLRPKMLTTDKGKNFYAPLLTIKKAVR